MVETAHRKGNEYLQVGARLMSKAYNVANLSECSRIYDSANKTKLLIDVVFKISADKVQSSYLHINVHARFDIGGGDLKISKVKLRSYLLALGPILSLSSINPPVVSPNLNLTPNLSRIEVDDNFTFATRNDKNLLEFEAEEVDTIFKGPRNTSRNPNSRCDIDCYGVRWMVNNLDTKRDQNGSIFTRR